MAGFMCFVCALFLAMASSKAAHEPAPADTDALIFPAILTFGDSALDVGNNNHRFTSFKANYPPYGQDFFNHKPTGRFSNGKLVSDITAENLGFQRYPPAYLSAEAAGRNLLTGAAFASAAAGYDEEASISNRAITLGQQLINYKEYQSKVAMVAGPEKSAAIVRDGLHILSCGTGDYLQNYYIKPAVRKRFTPDQYSSFLVASFSKFVKDLHGIGARKIGVTSIPPLGCFPAALTQFGYQQKKGCVRTINNHILVFNRKLNSTAATLRKQLPDLKLVIFDVFKPLYDVIMSPENHGFDEVRRGCCGTGAVETASVLCNPKSHVMCSNSTKYMFWDNVHPSEAANHILADAMLVQGYALI